MKKGCLMLVSALLLVGCSPKEKNSEPSSTPKEQAGQEANIAVREAEIVAENLKVPWSIQKDQDTFYISERPGNIAEITNGNLKRYKVRFEKPLSTAAEAGFLGFVLHPDFRTNKRAFAYYTYEDSAGQFNRIVELVRENEGWREEKLLLDRIPSGQFHHGGRLKIGPDGKLYVTAGDAAKNPAVAQDLKSLNGKILRMKLDGTVPEDNPFPQSYVYSYGHRNPQGLAWDSSGNLFASEHGQSAHDELNQIKPRANYGWPVISGDEEKTGMEKPLFHTGEETWAPSGIAINGNKVYVATLRGTAVQEFDLVKKRAKTVISDYGRIRDVFIEGDSLYFISNNTDGRGEPRKNDDKLYRIPLKNLP